MAALVAATQDHPSSKKIMGGRDKPGHDGYVLKHDIQTSRLYFHRRQSGEGE
jgi:hypothetical protein